MITQDSVLVQLIRLVDLIPTPPPPTRRPRGRPIVYSDRLFLKALLIMIVRRLHKVGELLGVWIPLCARLTPANVADNRIAPLLI